MGRGHGKNDTEAAGEDIGAGKSHQRLQTSSWGQPGATKSSATGPIFVLGNFTCAVQRRVRSVREAGRPGRTEVRWSKGESRGPEVAAATVEWKAGAGTRMTLCL